MALRSLLAQNMNIDMIMESYRLGQLDKTYEALIQNMNTFGGTEKLQAYRLLSLTCLALDRFDEAKEAAGKLLALEPYYTPSWDDPTYFKRLIESLKSSKNTIVSASRQAETLEEASSSGHFDYRRYDQGDWCTNLKGCLDYLCTRYDIC